MEAAQTIKLKPNAALLSHIFICLTGKSRVSMEGLLGKFFTLILVSAVTASCSSFQFTCKVVQHENTNITCPLFEKGTVNFESYEHCMDNMAEDGCDMVILIHKLVRLICDVHKYCKQKSPDTKLDFFEEFLHFLVDEEKVDTTTEI
ncbi:hypothetical protein GQX74_012433 [Glossina fuscipes]|nr:hypothetical protein GQX74_012433 [Glossina fuscipes]